MTSKDASYYRAYRASRAEAGRPVPRGSKSTTSGPSKGHGKHHPKRERIIAIDGEGCTLPSGAHRYTYIAACSADELVSDLYDPKGLTANRILSWLVSLPASALLVGYSLGYDRTKWLESWPDDALWLLHHPDARKSDKGFPLPVEVDGWRVNLVSTRLSLKRYEDGKHRTVWDIWKFFQSSFLKALERLQVGTARERGLIKKEKVRRKDFTRITTREREYCQLECRLLAKLARVLIDAHHEEGLDLKSYFGPGSTASLVLKTTAKGQRARYPDAMREAVMSAYFGGRFECSRVGPVKPAGSIEPGLFSYDITSAYPHAMTRLPCMRRGHGQWVHGEWRANSVGLIRWELHAHKDMCEAWGPLPYRLPDGNILFPLACAGGWVWSDEFLAAQVLHPGLRGLEVWAYQCNCDCPPPFAARIAELFERRKQWGKSTRGIVLKLALNSLYGKSCQRAGKGRYRCYVRAGLITSMTRAMLLRAVALAHDPWNVLELATDSVLSREPLPLERHPQAVHPLSGLGAWERKPWSGGAMLIRPGMRFALDTDGDVAARGLGVKVLRDNRKHVMWQWEREPMAPVTLPTPSFFHGAKLCVRRLVRDVSHAEFFDDEVTFEYRRDELYGRWTDEHRTIRYGAPPKRAEVMPDYRLRPWAFDPRASQVSVPYMGQQSTIGDELDEMRELEEDQPDPGAIALV